MRVRVELQLRYANSDAVEWLAKTVSIPHPLPKGARYHAEPERKDYDYDTAWHVLECLWHEQEENYYLKIGKDTKRFDNSTMQQFIKHYKAHGWKRKGDED